MTFDEALARRKAQRNIVPFDASDEQHFRHGWDAALSAAAALCEAKFADHYDHSGKKAGALECAAAIRELEVEVQT